MKTIAIGDRDSLFVEGEWIDAPHGGASNRTRGRFRVSLRHRPIWGEGGPLAEGGIEWTWVELLESLAESWPFLAWAEAYPFPLNPRDPLGLETALAEHADEINETEFDLLSEKVTSFLERHDLAWSLRGLSARSFRVLTQGQTAVVSTPVATAWLPQKEVFSILAGWGDEIAARLRGADDPRSKSAVKYWDNRLRDRRLDLAAIYTGLSSATLNTALEGSGIAIDPMPLDQFRPNEFLAAARMVGPQVAPDELRPLFVKIAALPKTAPRALELVSQKYAGLPADVKDRRWFEQGVEMAREVRADLPGGKRLGLLDIESVMAKLGVTIDECELPPELDAVAVWGPNHGPAVILNPKGLHNGVAGGRRATLAHELCHMIFDRSGALPISEALGGRAPKAIERRANAFAAELLLPAEAVTDEAANRELTPADCLRIFERYEVSRQLGARRVLNAEVRLSLDVRKALMRWADDPASA